MRGCYTREHRCQDYFAIIYVALGAIVPALNQVLRQEPVAHEALVISHFLSYHVPLIHTTYKRARPGRTRLRLSRKNRYRGFPPSNHNSACPQKGCGSFKDACNYCPPLSFPRRWQHQNLLWYRFVLITGFSCNTNALFTIPVRFRPH